jgi:hypothetical protein
VPYRAGMMFQVVPPLPYTEDCCTVNCCCWDGPSVAVAGLICARAVAPAQKNAIDRNRDIDLYDMIQFL